MRWAERAGFTEEQRDKAVNTMLMMKEGRNGKPVYASEVRAYLEVKYPARFADPAQLTLDLPFSEDEA